MIQSYVERRGGGLAHIDWDFQPETLDSQEHRREQQGFLQVEDQLDGINQSQTLPAPPMPPPQPIWHHTSYARSLHRSEFVRLNWFQTFCLFVCLFLLSYQLFVSGGIGMGDNERLERRHGETSARNESYAEDFRNLYGYAV